ncbi:MAG: tRNA uridine-5-carboxymethylaminomethyl(34) synthesis GTPase MnmE [Prevotella sp.]|nr:tRNA uridine-5-carboxymethylaminomethyl(34) synthesis GTPase MnmE [Prevotella sp.]
MQSNTICALATAPGGALGLIRVSGQDAITVTEKIFHAKSNIPLSQRDTKSLIFGQIRSSSNEIIDEVLLSVFHAPHSYTGENCVEISCHGSRYIIDRILEELIYHGCRMALPGEYTKRAFLNGKMDLSQAESVADLIAAENKASHDVAMSQMKGGISNELAQMREQLIHIASLLELELDFSEEDVEFANRAELQSLITSLDRQITTLIVSFRKGKAIKDGVPVIIVGKTNVGKSTLLNRLLDDERAIVSDVHGTTRDLIEDTTTINDVSFRFIDTAGLRKTDDVVENIGIRRTYDRLSQAMLVLWVIDETPSRDEIDEMRKQCEGKSVILVINKTDIKQVQNTTPFPTVSISAQYDENLQSLENEIFTTVIGETNTMTDVIVSNQRHYDILLRAKESVENINSAIHSNLPSELIAEDLKNTIHILAEITGGEITSTDVLESIFSQFCIGK